MLSALRRTGLISLAIFVATFSIIPVASTPEPALAGNDVTVNTTTDTDDGVCNSSHCSLREAINRVNVGGIDFLNFGIDAVSDPGCIAFGDPDTVGVCTIGLQGELPHIEEPVIIDGYSQPGASENTLAVGNDAHLKIVLDLTNGILGQSGLHIVADDTTVRGLVINGTPVNTDGLSGGAGIYIDQAANATIEGNFIGTNVSGSAAVPLATDGIVIDGGSSHLIGGATPAARNVISGNGTAVYIEASILNSVRGNYIGTNADGTAAVSNAFGVEILSLASVSRSGRSFPSGITDSDLNVVDGNLISGNTEAGVRIDSSHNTQVSRNYIGTNAAGTAAIPNDEGVRISNGASDNLVGGGLATARQLGPEFLGNLISGNTGQGVLISNADNNYVRGNFIGTNASGTSDISNQYGVFISEGFNNEIGGAGSDLGNVISGNTRTGVRITGQSGETGSNFVRGNYVGTNALGTAAIPNADYGIEIEDSANNVIGGDQPGEGNLISGNERYGLRIAELASANNTVQGNYIGTNAAGNAAIPNEEGGVSIDDAPLNLIGGTTEGARNIISGNGFEGINIDNAGATANLVQGNYIGTDASGTTAIPNPRGLFITAPNNTIGGTSAGAGNRIAFNDDQGVLVHFDAAANTIEGNEIFSNGDIGIDLGFDGVTPNDPGDADAGPNNLQNFPQLTQAIAGSLSIKGTFDSTPNTAFRFEFFVNDDCDPTGFGEGQSFFGGGDIATDDDGVISFTANSGQNVQIGKYITATATNNATGDTSEFSNCVEVQPEPEPTPTPTGSFTPTPTPVPLGTPTPTPTPTATPPPTPTPTPTAPGQTPTPTPTLAPTPTSTPTPTAGVSQAIQGDNDCDGDSDAVDALQILLVLAGLQPNQQPGCPQLGTAVPAGGDPQLFGDIDCDGDVDAVDALQILLHVAGLPVNQSAGCVQIGDPL